jgi:arsenite oxidase large subunit
MAEVFRFANRVPIPPTTAKKSRTSCQYCIVGCGYNVYMWPTDVPEGGVKASENALGVDLPASALSGQWISPGMYNRTAMQDGRSYHVVIVPDKGYEVNQGNHSIRGGTNAQSIWTPFGPTADRLTAPLLKVGGAQQAISWDAALTLVSGVLKHAVSTYGPQGTAFRMYAYQWFENTYAITKLYFQHIGTPNGAMHNRASFGGETTALEDTGMSTWNIAYVDAEKADVIFEVGAGGYENQTVLFTQHIMNHGAKLIVQDPRKTMDAAYALANDGLHLRLKPGTDAVLLNAIARVIVDNGWQDKGFISQFMTSSSTDIQTEENWRRQHFGMTFSDYQQMLQNSQYEVGNAAQFTGVPADQIQKAAQLIAKPNAQGQRPKTLFLFEKGLIWGINYQNVAALANLALLVGSIGQEGRGVSRSGGHQEGYASPVDYPMQNATDKGLLDQKLPNYIDAHMESGEVKVYHVIGANPAGMTNSSQHFREMLTGLLNYGPTVESSDTQAALDALIARMDGGGMVLIAQDIYPNLTTEMADLVLPAAAWGEMNGVRINGERRARLYEQFMDSPGQAKRDWWIVAQIAQRMGFSGFDWKTDEDVFNELAPHAQYDASGIVQYAQSKGTSPYAVLRSLQNGIQLPAKFEHGQLVGTLRLLGDHKFGTKSGKAMFINSDWSDIPAQVYTQLQPQGDEFWVINGRVDELWQTMYTHKRVPFILERWPSNHVEIHPADATRLGVQSGDMISLSSDRVVTQKPDTFDKGSFTAVAYVSDIVPPGVVFTNFAYPDQWMNSISPRWMHPANPIPPYKLARARLTRIGPSDLASHMSFAPRNLVS